jgi:two-component system, response regulator PdtaR
MICGGIIFAAISGMATLRSTKLPRWRVVIVDDHERSRAAARAAVWAAGGEVAGEATRAADALELVRETSPDAAIFAAGLSDGDGVEAAREVTLTIGCPVVLCTSRTGDDLVDRARTAGVMAFLLKPLRPAELAPALDLAIARHAEARALRQSLQDRKVIEKAKGALMARFGLAEDVAFRRLRKAAMDSRNPMVEIARALLVSEAVTRESPAP